MKGILIRVLSILLVIAIVVLCYYIAEWVLGMLGIHIPGQILNVIFVIVGLLAALFALTGRMDTYFISGGPVP